MEAIKRVLAEGWFREQDTAVVLYDLDALEARVEALRGAFPAETLHAFAVKACPLPPVLAMLAQLGLGAEAASLGEIHLALAAGFPSERIVFDSPAKTVEELRLALTLGLFINADNLDELARLDALGRYTGLVPRAGLRVNPQAGTGRIKATSVAGRYSKFGVPLAQREAIVDAFGRYPWLSGLHVHIGSQGCSLELLVAGVGAVHDLAADLDARFGPGRVAVFDLGGGLPAAYRDADRPPSPQAYVDALRLRSPGLAGNQRRLVTEFGRMLAAPCAVAASRLEYVKRQPGHRTAVMHLGADMFVRECYNPRFWPHRTRLLRADGLEKTGKPVLHHLAGPLCFSGDFPVRRAMLPEASAGDIVVIEDVGAYTLSMWSRYNSRQMPRVLGLRQGRFSVLREREEPEDLVRFWLGGSTSA
ncbi:MAG: diaminopimelate decarboxylase [Solidesulfovibrio magneticus str. Maddingley MBC34]|uniref:Diaminopimelate decarboxylase n=1 Tax=Solidesulfovibrio magneticus str. Maddingley MBC34 TaxID=1206767 RepID=K6GKW9_9BACT|nr:MAG: diaminopimelate decarboxylase [Solidesulfovibrio magneticus str. Maddingley MBC34]